MNLQNKIMTLEEDFAKNNTHIFRSVRELEGKKQKSCMVLKDSQGVIRMKKQEVLTIWQTHFEKHLNTQFPHDEDALSELDGSRSKARSDKSPMVRSPMAKSPVGQKPYGQKPQQINI